ncbi:hypothetical protein BO94DRAFT_550295 [Aspergillus sclerotioniger CBS 115572]|uniref:Uncharacterized protein n=1 Tax=Aspergillus sclerotioniger CBS 115572 TaxID=1450535 RepID=A0A317VBT3_9EURO|nr:hypothetical protein BO94DRAFT_550295 [Aspergillus sclerotioniger CBS 115572]PWY71814.1 hypothetical protein BO94DRAFT_550295 [Aspergillus sclerotioniger CBS 115572]
MAFQTFGSANFTSSRSLTIGSTLNGSQADRSTLRNVKLLAGSKASRSTATNSTIQQNSWVERSTVNRSTISGSSLHRSTLNECEVENCVLLRTAFSGMVLKNGVWRNGILVGKLQEGDVVMETRNGMIVPLPENLVLEVRDASHWLEGASRSEGAFDIDHLRGNIFSREFIFNPPGSTVTNQSTGRLYMGDDMTPTRFFDNFSSNGYAGMNMGRGINTAMHHNYERASSRSPPPPYTP